MRFYPVEDGAELLTIGEWLNGIQQNAFTPDDGHGFYAYEGEQSDVPVDFNVEDAHEFAAIHHFTHVAWYSK